MIIDAHHHLNGGFDWRPDAFNRGFERAIRTNLKRLTGQDFDSAFVRENIQPSFIDTNGDKIVEGMDEAGVDKTVIFDVDYDYGMGTPKVSFEERIKFSQDVSGLTSRVYSRVVNDSNQTFSSSDPTPDYLNCSDVSGVIECNGTDLLNDDNL